MEAQAADAFTQHFLVFAAALHESTEPVAAEGARSRRLPLYDRKRTSSWRGCSCCLSLLSSHAVAAGNVRQALHVDSFDPADVPRSHGIKSHVSKCSDSMCTSST
jgi:hypothetical protein